MKLALLALASGFLVGFIFSLLRLPIPAPPALPGVAGVVGVYLGFKVFEQVSPWIQSIFK